MNSKKEKMEKLSKQSQSRHKNLIKAKNENDRLGKSNDCLYFHHFSYARVPRQSLIVAKAEASQSPIVAKLKPHSSSQAKASYYIITGRSVSKTAMKETCQIKGVPIACVRFGENFFTEIKYRPRTSFEDQAFLFYQKSDLKKSHDEVKDSRSCTKKH